MRAKRVILLVDLNANQLAERACLLNVRGYAALVASTRDEAVQMLAEEYPIDVVLIDIFVLPSRWESLIPLAKKLRDGVMVLLTGELRPGTFAHRADGYLWKPTNAELLDRLRVLSSKKRGPKPVRVDARGRQTAESLNGGDDANS